MQTLKILPLFEDYIKDYDYNESDDLAMPKIDNTEIINKETPGEFEYIPFDDVNDFKNEEYGLDMNAIKNEGIVLGKSNGISISPNKDLFYIVIEKSTANLAGCLWTEIDANYSFDIAVYPQYRKNGIATNLIKIAVDEYKKQKSSKGDDFEMEVYAVNPKMKDMLETKFGFEVINKIAGTYLMSL